jgi:hypothetical protein
MTNDAEEHIDMMAKKDLGCDTYPAACPKKRGLD